MKTLNYFNINGSVGSGAYEAPDFAEISDLIKHLDYLGIDRSLVWHIHFLFLLLQLIIYSYAA